MRKLARFDPWWIEEPTSPDDVLGHAAIARAIAPIGVATGEHCQNRVVFKQLLQANAIRFCQIDSCRLGGVNEILAVLLMAKKFGVPVCPHAGGVGLCEYVQHLSIFDYVCVSASLENRLLEFVDHLHEHFVDPVRMKNGRYMPPEKPGYSITMKRDSLDQHEYPSGRAWQVMRMIKTIIFDLGKVIVPFDFQRGYDRMAPLCRYSPAEIPERLRGCDLVTRFEEGKIEPDAFVTRTQRDS